MAIRDGQITVTPEQAIARELYAQRQRDKRELREANVAARAARSHEEQLKLLDQRPGESRKERARLEALIKAAAEAPKPKAKAKGKTKAKAKA